MKIAAQIDRRRPPPPPPPEEIVIVMDAVVNRRRRELNPLSTSAGACSQAHGTLRAVTPTEPARTWADGGNED